MAARYMTAAGQTIPNNANTTVVFGTKDYDTHNAYNASTGRYTAPMSGKYRIDGLIMYGATTLTANAEYSVYLGKNGTGQTQVLGANIPETANTASLPIKYSGEINLLASETIDIVTYQSAGGTRGLLSQSAWNWVVIERVGN